MLQTILAYLWERRTTALGYVVTALGIMATSDLFTARQIKWFLLINGILLAILGHYNNRQVPSVPQPRQGGFASSFMLALLLALAAPAVLTLSGCGSTPVQQAETPEQKAYALYGTYVIFQEKAAELVQDPAIPENVKQALRDSDRIAYPVAESLVEAVIEVEAIRQQVKAGMNSEERLTLAILNLSTIYFSAAPKLLAVVSAVKETK